MDRNSMLQGIRDTTSIALNFISNCTKVDTYEHSGSQLYLSRLDGLCGQGWEIGGCVGRGTADAAKAYKSVPRASNHALFGNRWISGQGH